MAQKLGLEGCVGIRAKQGAFVRVYTDANKEFAFEEAFGRAKDGKKIYALILGEEEAFVKVVVKGPSTLNNRKLYFSRS